ncbi:unnamed protein product [Adineta ricciae]|uniref:Uncharacterized protein n=1 Tax=Adineta ricciae TaxID=249248 RepID=A0A815KT57_ADIRI|nr:unnamed protein product [Adineta ricciae]CAF1397859.1 unnamed protein product [Adineta ricciae]
MFILEQTSGQCLYPAWETTCQKYCLEHQYYRIQTNQCWSKDPKHLRCQCNGLDLTEKIKAILLANENLDTIVNNPS